METHTKTQVSFQAISQGAKANPIESGTQGMMPVTPSVPRMPPQRTPPPRRSNLVPPQRTAHSSPPPAQRMSIRQQQHGLPMPMSGRGGPPGGPTLMTSPRPPVVVSTPVGQRRYDDGAAASAAGGVKSPALMSQYLEPPPMKPKFGTQVNWNPSHFVPSIPSPLNRAQQELSCQ